LLASAAANNIDTKDTLWSRTPHKRYDKKKKKNEWKGRRKKDENAAKPEAGRL